MVDSAMSFTGVVQNLSLIVDTAKNLSLVGSSGIDVQIDETSVAKQKFNKGLLVKERWLFDGVCPEQGRGFVCTIPVYIC